MKILIAVDTYFPRLGGGEVLAYQLATFLKKSGHEVTILTPEQGESPHDAEFPTFRPVFSRKPRALLQFLKTYNRLVKEHDVVHSMCAHKMAAIGGLLSLLHGKKLAITLIGHGILDLPGNTTFFATIHWLYRVVSLRCAHVVFDGSLEFAAIARRYIPARRIVRMPNSVDMESFKAGVKDYSLVPFTYTGEPLIFILRRLVPKNGVQFLVEATPYILRTMPNAHIFHIGWGYLEEALKARVAELGVGEHFHFVGRVENTKVQSYINIADVVVFPSTAESTSIACLESMAMGKPIVASNVGGFPEMITDGWNGRLVNLTDTLDSNYGAPMTLPEEKLQALADAITDVLSGKAGAHLGEHSLERVRREFSWQENIKKIIAAYD